MGSLLDFRGAESLDKSRQELTESERAELAALLRAAGKDTASETE